MVQNRCFQTLALKTQTSYFEAHPGPSAGKAAYHVEGGRRRPARKKRNRKRGSNSPERGVPRRTSGPQRRTGETRGDQGRPGVPPSHPSRTWAGAKKKPQKSKGPRVQEARVQCRSGPYQVPTEESSPEAARTQQRGTTDPLANPMKKSRGRGDAKRGRIDP